MLRHRCKRITSNYRVQQFNTSENACYKTEMLDTGSKSR